MTNDEFPSDWEVSELEELARFIDYRGKTPQKTTDGIPLITAKNIRDGFLSDEPREFIAEADYEPWMTRGIPQFGDVLITTEAPLGNVAQINLSYKFALAQRAICLQPFLYGIENWLAYALRAPQFQALLLENSTGTTVKGIKAATLKKLNIPVPPLAEQKQIAAKLDELMAQVDTIKTRLDAIPHILKRFRQSVLAAAVSGTLGQPGECKTGNWKVVKIADLCHSAFDGPFGSKLKSDDYTEKGTRVVRLENIGHLRFDDDKKTYISNEKYEQLFGNALKPSDILFSSFVDQDIRVCMLPDLKESFINKADCFCLRMNTEKCDVKFIMYVLASRQTYDRIKDQVHGATRPRINLGFLKKFEVEIPQKEEQTEIVRRVEQLFAYADQIEQRVKDAQARVNHLTQSILAKAFRGELTADWRAQNPDLISGDNSAEALLARIRAEREADASKPKTRRKKV